MRAIKHSNWTRIIIIIQCKERKKVRTCCFPMIKSNLLSKCQILLLYLKFALIMWGSFCCCCSCFKNGSSSNSFGTKDDEKSVVIYEATLISSLPEDPPSSSPTFESFSSVGFDPSLSIASESIAEVSENESESSEKSENTVIFNAFKDHDVSDAAELIFQYQNIDRDYHSSREVHQSWSGKL